jgi:hypothetical protein
MRPALGSLLWEIFAGVLQGITKTGLFALPNGCLPMEGYLWWTVSEAQNGTDYPKGSVLWDGGWPKGRGLWGLTRVGRTKILLFVRPVSRDCASVVRGGALPRAMKRYKVRSE